MQDHNETTTAAALADHLNALVSRLTLQRKVALLTGGSFWSTVPLEEVGLRSMVLSDGPSGVRGERWDERDPSISFPAATALSASWDPDLAELYGVHAGLEARRKGVDVVLGPTINLHRSPLGGRGFESFSEDPILTAELAAAYVRGVQSQGVAATVKHFVANDYETERLTASSEVDERTLREMYLTAFEKPIRDAHSWLVMTAYNSINGVTATEHPLLDEPLSGEWGFDGVVVSDWGAVRSLDAATGRQDLVMPGPDGPWGEKLVAAVHEGRLAEAVIDAKVLRILLLAARVGALTSVQQSPVTGTPDSSADSFVRAAAAAGIVLVKNGYSADAPALPLDEQAIGRVGVFGQNARFARTQGGGSATVVPRHAVSPLEAIESAVGSQNARYLPGVALDNGLLDFPLGCTRVPDGTENGVLVQFYRGQVEIHREVRGTGMLLDFDPGAPFEKADRIAVSTVLDAGDLSWMRVGFAALGRTILTVDEVPVLDETLGAEGVDLGAAFLHSPIASVDLTAYKGPIRVRFDHDIRSRPEGSFFSFSYGLDPQADDETLIREAAAEAAECDVAIVVVGTSSRVESEGFDRTSLSLPGQQDALVDAIASTGTTTIVVVNSGAPVLLPWRDRVDAILVSWFGGQEYGSAVADVIFGRAEPGGRLPMSWPARPEDAPVDAVTPVDGVVRYDEGVHVGYRGFLRSGTTPAYEFGAGTSFTTFVVQAAVASEITANVGTVTLRVSVTNTGLRDGKHVVQIYGSRQATVIDRPARWLVAFAPVVVSAGQTRIIDIEVPRRSFAHWDVAEHGWRYEPGTFTLHVSRSVTIDDASFAVEIPADASDNEETS